MVRVPESPWGLHFSGMGTSLCVGASFFYTPTAVGYTPTAVGCPPTAVGYTATTVGSPPTAVSVFFFPPR